MVSQLQGLTYAFICMMTFVPLLTLTFESLFNSIILKENSIISPEILLATILMIIGGVSTVINKIITDYIQSEEDKEYALKIVRSTEVFADHNPKKAAKILEITPEKFTEILESKNFKILKAEFKQIQNNFNKKVAMSDHLTGLCSRLEFLTELKHIDKKSTASLFFIDLNKFKPVNDTYGHEAGDFILNSLARRLEHLFADSTLTRMGGDEFSLIVKNVTSVESIEMIETIQNEIAKPYHYEGIEINVSASAGFANYPKDTDNPVKLLNIADEQMFFDKQDSDR